MTNQETYKNKYTTYTYEKGIKTYNEQQSNNIKQTVDNWKEEGFKHWNKPLGEIPHGIFIKYVGSYKDGSIKTRNGGVVMKNDPKLKYLALRNTAVSNRASFSVQYHMLKDDNHPLVGVYYRTLPNKQLKKGVKDEHSEVSKEKKLTDNEKEQILNKVYYIDQNFVGRDKLYKIIQDKGYKITRTFVEKWLKKQVIYQLTKPNKNSHGTQSLISKAPFNIIAADLASFGKKIFLIVIDVFSRKAFGEFVKDKKPATVKEAFIEIFDKIPTKPKLLLTDNGGEFKNATMREFFNKEEIKRIFTIAGNPQSNGIVERFNGTIKRLMNKASMMTDKPISNEIFQKLIDNYNNMEHSTTGFKPNEALKPENKEQVITNTRKASRFNFNQKDDLHKGDKVRLNVLKDDNKIKKSDINWTEEIFTIDSVRIPRTRTGVRDPSRPVKYKVIDAKGEPVKGYLNRDELQKIEATENKDKANVTYEVEKLLDKKKTKGKWFVLVKWKGYPESEASWEPLKTIKEDLGLKTYKELSK